MGSGSERSGARNGRAVARGAADAVARQVDARELALRALLRRVAAGDEAAFAELYDAVAGRVFGLARRIAGDVTLAEEVAQEVLVEVWRTAPRFDATRGSASGWILMLTHRRTVDRVRSATARRAREERHAHLHPVQASVDDGLIADAEREEVRSALAHLTPIQREAIELAYYGGRTYREVAQVLDVPEGTAKSRLRDGLRRLRTTLEGGDR